MEILYILIIGAVAGWLAGVIMKGYGFGLIGNIIVGIVGSFIGGFVLSKLGVNIATGDGTINTIVTSVIGAVILLFVVGLIKRT